MTDHRDQSISRDKPALLRLLINGAIWSFLGVILTVLFFYWSQYRNPYNFQISLDDEVDLVEVRERIEDLQIKYKNEDILNTPKALKMLRITLRNSGKTILQNQYDQLEPFGLLFRNAEVLDATVMDSNSDYLRTHLMPKKQQIKSPDGNGESGDPRKLRLDKVIFEKDKFVSLKIFVLQQKKAPIEVSALGKIGNLEYLYVRRDQGEEKSWRGPAIPIISFMTAYAGIIAGMLSLVFFIEVKKLRKRRARIRRFVDSHPGLTSIQKSIVEAYHRRWGANASRIVKRLAAGDVVLDLHEHFKKERESLRKLFLGFFFLPRSMRLLLDPIALSQDIFVCDGITIKFNTENLSFLREFFTLMGEIPEEAEQSISPDSE